MYIVNNAWKNLRRNFSRTAIMVMIMFLLILAAAVSIIINTSASELIDQYKEQFGAEVHITRDDTKLPEDPSEFMVPNKELLDRLASSKLLKDVTKTMSSAVIVDGIKTVNEGNIPKGNSGIIVDNSGTDSKDMDASYQSPNAVIFATTNPAISNEFKQGQRKIVSGAMYQHKNEGIISKQLAQAGHINVGDTITVKEASFNPSASSSASQKIKITGIYEDHTERADSGALTALNTRANEIYISFSSTENSSVLQDGAALYDVYFTLKHPEDIEALQKEFHQLGLPDYYQVTMNDAMYQRIVGPVEGMADITRSFVIGVVVLGAVLLIILSVFTIRERRYEVGVLRAIGMKKQQVMRSFLYESLLITGMSLILGLGGAAVVSEPIGNRVFDIQRSQTDTESDGFVETGLQISSADISEIKEVPASLQTEAALQIICIAILLAFSASAVSVIFITRYEPMKILSERN